MATIPDIIVRNSGLFVLACEVSPRLGLSRTVPVVHDRHVVFQGTAGHAGRFCPLRVRVSGPVQQCHHARSCRHGHSLHAGAGAHMAADAVEHEEDIACKQPFWQ